MNFQDQTLFETEVIKEIAVFKTSLEAHQFAIFLRYHELEANILRAFIFL